MLNDFSMNYDEIKIRQLDRALEVYMIFLIDLFYSNVNWHKIKLASSSLRKIITCITIPD